MNKTRIVLCSNINESEKLKSLAIFNEDTFDLHYMSTLEVAKYLLNLSGISLNQIFIKDDELSAALYTHIKEIDYFKDLSYNDILALIKSINRLRHFILENERDEINTKLALNPTFKKKNEAVIEVYNLMMEYLSESNLIDEVGIIRFALENTKVFPNIKFIIYVNSSLDFTCPSIDKALIDKASGKVVHQTVIASKKINIKKYTKAFGQTNEIEIILNFIYENKIPFDQCLIASAETSNYSNILKNYRDLLNFPLTIGVGTNINETNPGKLFMSCNNFLDSNFHASYLNNIIYNDAFDLELFKEDIKFDEESIKELNTQLEYPYLISFDSIIKTVGDLRITFQYDVNNEKLEDYKKALGKFVESTPNDISIKRRILELGYVKAIFDIFDNGFPKFVLRYSKVIDKKDEDALEKLNRLFKFAYVYDISVDDIVKTEKVQEIAREPLKEGSLYFTSIANASSCLRPYLFIVGLSSNNFPGSLKEDPMIIDKDYKAFGVNESESSYKQIKDNKNAFFNLLYEANKYNINVYLSYAHYNSETLKPQNASSVIFDAYNLENNNSKTIADLENEFKNNNPKFVSIDEFYKFNLLPTSKIGNKLAKGESLDISEEAMPSLDKEINVYQRGGRKGFSASAINNFVNCEYLFFLANVLRIPEPEKIDIFELIPPNAYGTLAHSLLEHLDKSKVKTKEEFAVIAKEIIEDYFMLCPTDNIPLKAKLEDEFVKMMVNAYEMDKGDRSVLKEEDNGCLHNKSNLLIHGLPDSVVERGGKLWIIDYKTYNTLRHDPKDPLTMLQCVVYAYVLKTLGYEVGGFEYWYLKQKKIIRSDDNGLTMDDYYHALDEVMLRMLDAFETGNFKPSDDANKCNKCYYKDICPRKMKK